MTRSRLIVITLCGTTVIVVIIAAFVILSLARRDTTDLWRFVSILLGSLIPSVLGAWQATQAAKHSQRAAQFTEQVVETLNGGHDGHPGLDERMQTAARLANTQQTNEEGGKPDGRSTV